MTQAASPLISLGIILYNNTLDEIEYLFKSIKAQTHSNLELLIRNNGKDFDFDFDLFLKEYFHDTKITSQYFRGDNVGFGAGHNKLFLESSPNSTAYICINPDGILHYRAIEKLLCLAESCDFKGIFEALQEPISHPKYYNPDNLKTDWCSGACLMIPKKIYQEINGFDEDYFLYCEDVDISWRVRAKGYDCYTCVESLFYHDARDRSSVVSELFKSGLLLAHKWRADIQFRKMIYHYFMSTAGTSQDVLDNAVAKYNQHDVQDIYRVLPNFNNAFFFAVPLRK